MVNRTKPSDDDDQAYREEVGERLRQTRDRLKMVRKQFAYLMGCTEAMIRRYESGKTVPPSDRIRRLVKAEVITHGEMWWILCGDGSAGHRAEMMQFLITHELSHWGVSKDHEAIQNAINALCTLPKNENEAEAYDDKFREQMERLYIVAGHHDRGHDVDVSPSHKPKKRKRE